MAIFCRKKESIGSYYVYWSCWVTTLQEQNVTLILKIVHVDSLWDKKSWQNYMKLYLEGTNEHLDRYEYLHLITLSDNRDCKNIWRAIGTEWANVTDRIVLQKTNRLNGVLLSHTSSLTIINVVWGNGILYFILFIFIFNYIFLN